MLQHRRPLLFLLAGARLAARRLWANRRLAAGLLAGFAVAVAAASSVPVFTAMSLQRVLQAELKASPERMPAAVHLAYFGRPNRAVSMEQFLTADEIARERGTALLGLPLTAFVRFSATELGAAQPEDPARVNPNRARWMAVAFQSDLVDQITLIDGRLPQPGPRADGTLEALVEEEALDKQDFTVGARFRLPLGRGERAPSVRIEVVGAFRRSEPEHPYWFQPNPYEQLFLLPEESFSQAVLPVEGMTAAQYSWYYGIPADALQVSDAIRFLSAMYELEARAAQALPGTELFSGPMERLTRFAYRAVDLQLMLLLLAVPLLAVVGYFVVGTSGMIVERQRQEIAVLRSRGAGTGQVLWLYLLEGGLLASAAAAVGWPLGLLLARLMGLATGFLELVDRPLPSLPLPPEFWAYGATAAALAILAYVIPAVGATRQSIVVHKRESGRQRRVAVWARVGLDLIALGLAAYAYFTIRSRPAQPVGSGPVEQMDPLQILAPALLVMGAGLLIIRIVPLLGRMAARVADRWAGAPLYLALTQLGRAPAGYLTAIFLLTLTVGMGLYSAAAARTLAANATDRLWYAAGAEVVLDEVFDYQEAGNSGSDSAEATFIPPPWEIHYDLPGVHHPARVRREEVIPLVGGRPQRQGLLMAIDPPDFGRVAWFRSDLARAHFYDYLNALARDEEAVLVNSAFLKRNNLQLGDQITLMGDDGHETSLTIYGVFDYWPSYLPQQGDLFVANLDLVERSLGLRPYQVWLRMEPGARLQPVIDALRQEAVLTVSAVDARQQVIALRRDPTLNGMMGGLSSGFILSAVLTILGFWIHAALNARARTLQFGVLRALGLTSGQLSLVVVLEQTLAVAVGVLAGTGAGLLAARLFVPFLEQGGSARVPPFLVVMEPADRLRMYAILLMMLVVSVIGLLGYLKRLRIHEAVKLGEDH